MVLPPALGQEQQAVVFFGETEMERKGGRVRCPRLIFPGKAGAVRARCLLANRDVNDKGLAWAPCHLGCVRSRGRTHGSYTALGGVGAPEAQGSSGPG